MPGLYLHIPFCRSKCRYCDFASVPVGSAPVDPYLDALVRDMERFRGLAVETVFLGGGTPSLLSPGQMTRLFSEMRRLFSTAGLAETTAEGNPDSLGEETLRALKEAGVDRVSIGVQALSDDALRSLGRVHDTAAFEKAYAAARRRFDNVSIDLMYGIPSQSMDDWRETLRRAAGYRPEHLSLYPLTVEPGTPFAESGVQADGDLQAAMFEWAVEFLGAAGYEHYEISNWALPGRRCRHNMNYWLNGEYVGAGVAAASHRDGVRWKNTDDIATYIDCLRDGRDPVTEREEIDGDSRELYAVILGLRCSDGIRMTAARERRWGERVSALESEGLLSRAGDVVRLTTRGMLLANRVLSEFV